MKIKKLNKFLPIVLSCSMAIGNITPAFAETRVSLDTSATTADVEYNEESSLYNQNDVDKAETIVKISKPEHFSVIIPKRIVISGIANEAGEFEQTYIVTVKGDISGDKYIKVETPKAVLSNGNKTALNIDTNSAKTLTKFLQNDGPAIDKYINISTPDMASGKATTYNAKVQNKEAVKAGRYTGTVRFDIGLFDRTSIMVDEEATTPFTYTTTDTETANPVMGMLNLFGIHTVHADPVNKDLDETKVKGTAIITGLKDSSVTNINVADYYEDANGNLYKIQGIGNNAFANSNLVQADINNSEISDLGTGVFKGSSNLTDAVLPNNITAIPNETFKDCTSLENVNIPNKVTSIGNSAFENCTSLPTINIPENTTIGDNAFSGCTSLTNAPTVNPPTIIETAGLYQTDGSFIPWSTLNLDVETDYSLTSSDVNYYQTAEKSPYKVFKDNSYSGRLVLPDNITKIGDYSFYQLSELTAIEFSETLTSIGDNAFRNCSGLTSVDLSQTQVKNIGFATFSSCSSLENIDFSQNLISIGQGAFLGTKLNRLELPNTLSSIGIGAFQSCSNLDFVDLSNTQVTRLEDGTFDKCLKLRQIEFPNNLEFIGRQAFRSDSLIEVLDLSNTKVTTIGEEAFIVPPTGSSLKNIYFPNTLTTIGKNAFCRNNNLTDIDLSQTKMTSIGQSAFGSCTNLKNISFPETLTSVEYNAFYKCSLVESIDLSQTKLTTLENLPKSSKLTNIFLPNTLKTLGGTLSSSTSLSSIDLSQTQVTSINDSAFSNCSNLETIALPKDLKTIGRSAFSGCSKLSNIDLSQTQVTSIDDYAFSDCTNLKNILFPNTLTTLGLSGGYVFNNCTSLSMIDLRNTKIEVLRIVLSSCTSLKSIYLPVSLKQITVCLGCSGSNLTDIEYAGTKEQFNQMQVYKSTNSPHKTKTITCTNGTITF